MSIAWKFPKTRLDRAFSKNDNSSLSTDVADLSVTIGREEIQNAFDAKQDNNEPVKVRFRQVKFNNTDFFHKHLDGLTNRVSQMPGGYDLDGNFMNNPSFLIIEDFNTHGLTGKIDYQEDDVFKYINGEEINNYYQYFFAFGESAKKGTQGGRRGAGRQTFNLASALRTQLVISNRKDDEKLIMMGLCVGDRHIFEGRAYDQIGHYCQFDENDNDAIPYPIEDKNMIQELCKALDLEDRLNSFGSSFIIPYPYDLDLPDVLTNTLKSYYSLIGMGKLELEFISEEEKILINHKNITEVLIDYNLPNLADFLKFIFECHSTKEFITLKKSTVSDNKIEKDDFENEEQVKKLISSFHSNDIVSLNVPVPFTKKINNQDILSSFKVFIKQNPNAATETLFLRNNMPLIQEGENVRHSCYAYVLIEDDELSTMLAHSEGVNHVELSAKHPDLKKHYKNYYKTILCIKNSVKDTTSLILDSEDDDDFASFAPMYPKPDNSSYVTTIQPDNSDYEDGEYDEEVKDEEPEVKSKEIKITKVVPEFESNTSPLDMVQLSKSKGIKIKANLKKEGIGGSFPQTFKAEFSYREIGRSQSFKNQDKLDFDFNDENSKLKVDVKNAKIKLKTKNEIIFEALDKDFYLTVKNLVPRFDPEVRCTPYV